MGLLQSQPNLTRFLASSYFTLHLSLSLPHTLHTSLHTDIQLIYPYIYIYGFQGWERKSGKAKTRLLFTGSAFSFCSSTSIESFQRHRSYLYINYLSPSLFHSLDSIFIMEIQEEVMVVSKDHAQIMKGKRTRRQRAPSPLRLAIAMPSTSSSAGRTSTDEFSGGFDLANTSPPEATSAELRDGSTEEEEDMANCLILLAQGKSSGPVAAPKDGVYLYQCKTCERCFPSFQALGGHRASHKKLKPNPEEKQVGYDCTSTALSLQLSNRALLYCSKSKVHECSVCGAEFSSGQALGGHMRRHRTFVNASAATSSPESQDANKPRNVFKLDLNLPAPEDHDHRESQFPFHSKDSVLVFSSSPLVDCHY